MLGHRVTPCNEARIRPLSHTEIEEWLGYGALAADEVGIATDRTFNRLRHIEVRLMLNVRRLVEDIRLCKYAVAKAITSRQDFLEDIVQATLRVDTALWLGAQDAFREVVLVQVRGMMWVRSAPIRWRTDHSNMLFYNLQRFLHNFPVHDPRTVVVDRDDPIEVKLRCSVCGALQWCSPDVLLALPIKSLPPDLQLTGKRRTTLARMAWWGHNEDLKRELAGDLGVCTLPWWAPDVPEGVDPRQLLGSDHDPVTLRTLHRSSAALLEEPDTFIEQMRKQRPISRPPALRSKITHVLRAREPCDRTRAVWRLGDAARRVMLEHRLSGKYTERASHQNSFSRYPLGWG